MTHQNKNQHNHKPKPDDRSDNVEKLQDMVQDTIQNIEAAHETMQFASGEEKEQIMAKNKRREEAIEGMRAEIKDEYRHNHPES
ncbi:small acid-soluble spore protein Tlp [Ornithinibacillus caprae]|uniref:small acid-soluble spore protein Tlp n=1 Tax=Ornithinibacillus caprae TaxID=2678566 RepID=UPI0024832E9C|nr:small acid-soluble spore protein Tlp [Ornithinibacillus caprae]